MAGFATPAARKDALDIITGRVPTWAGGGTNRTTYIGLASAIPLDSVPTLSNISEVVAGGYARAAVTWREAVIDGSVVRVTNSTSISIGPLTEDLSPVPYAFLASVASGTTGTLLYVWELAESVGAKASKPLFVPVDQLIIE